MAAAPGRAEMLPLFREMFQTSGSLTAENPGTQFSTVSGAFYQRAGGPRLQGGQPASADMRLDMSSTYGSFDLGSESGDRIFFGAWFFFKTLQDYECRLLTVTDVGENAGPTISVTGGKIAGGITYLSSTPCPVPVINRWVFLGLAVSRQAGNIGDVRFYYQFPGGALIPWHAITAGTIGIANLRHLQVGALGNNPAIKCRIGSPLAYAFAKTDFSDIAYPWDLIEPETKRTWYCNPATGNDDNDGTSPQTAWATAAKINAESLHTGMFTADSYAEGDTLIVDTGAKELDLLGVGLSIYTAGLNVRAAAGQEWIRIKSYRTLAANEWVPAGIPNVYATTDTQSHIVMWENDKFLNHPTGANLAQVSDFLSTTPGSFWTDGSVLYVHPFGSTDPRVDGKRYERSYNFSNDPAEAAVHLAAPSLNVRDIHVGKTCLAHMLTNDAIMNYCMRCTSTGESVIAHCYLYYGAKHNLGIVKGDAGTRVTIDGVQAEQGSPYTWAGGQTVFVSFEGGPSDLGIVHVYRNCVSHANAGLIGSDQGTMTAMYPVFYSHNNGGNGQFARFEFDGCDFGSGGMGGNAVDEVLLTESNVGALGFGSNLTIHRCRILGGLQTTTGSSVVMRNSIQSWSGMLQTNAVAGVLDIQACILDASAVTHVQGGVPQAALFTRTGPLALTFRNNAVVMPAAPVGANVFSLLQASDSLSLSANAYRFGGNRLVYQYNNVSALSNPGLQDWQALGYDSGSFEAHDFMLAGYVPQAGSPLIGAGDDLGPLEDFTGALFSRRTDIGALQAIPAQFGVWKQQWFSPQERADHERTDPSVSFCHDGVSNLMKYALGLNPRERVQSSLTKAELLSDEGVVTLSHTRRRGASDLDYRIEESDDLRFWRPATVTGEEILAQDATAEWVRNRVALNGMPRKFLRLRVSADARELE